MTETVKLADGRTDVLIDGRTIGYVYRTGSRGSWIAKLYEDKRYWGPFTTKREAVDEVKVQAA
jgi:hypothetical protein